MDFVLANSHVSDYIVGILGAKKGLRMFADTIVLRLVGLVLVAMSSISCAVRPSARRENRAIYEWLKRQQQDTGLLGNQEADAVSGLYANALAAIAFTHEGDYELARAVFDFYASWYEREFADAPGGFHQMWNPVAGTPYAGSDRWIGDNAWLLIALNYYGRESGDDRYAAMQTGVARWLQGLQDEDGGVWSGFNADGPMKAKSTEGNLDCFAALEAYPETRNRVRRWLLDAMWIEKEKRFRMGSTVDASALDGTSWAIAALGPSFSEALAHAEKEYLRTDSLRGSNVEITGFADLPGRDRVWFEGTGQMVVAYQLCGEHEKAAAALGEMQRALRNSQRFPGTAGLPCFSSKPDWEGAADRIFVPSQAWYLFGLWSFNPMQTEQPPAE